MKDTFEKLKRFLDAFAIELSYKNSLKFLKVINFFRWFIQSLKFASLPENVETWEIKIDKIGYHGILQL